MGASTAAVVVAGVGVATSAAGTIYSATKSTGSGSSSSSSSDSVMSSLLNAQRYKTQQTRLNSEDTSESEYLTAAQNYDDSYTEGAAAAQDLFYKATYTQKEETAVQQADTTEKWAVAGAAVKVGADATESEQKAAYSTNMANIRGQAATLGGEITNTKTGIERDYAVETLRQEADAATSTAVAKMAARGNDLSGSALEVLEVTQHAANAKANLDVATAQNDIRGVTYNAEMTKDVEAYSAATSNAETFQGAIDNSNSVMTTMGDTVESAALTEKTSLESDQLQENYAVQSTDLTAKKSVDDTDNAAWRQQYSLLTNYDSESVSLDYSYEDNVDTGLLGAFKSSSAGESSSSAASSSNLTSLITGTTSTLKGASSLYTDYTKPSTNSGSTLNDDNSTGSGVASPADGVSLDDWYVEQGYLED